MKQIIMTISALFACVSLAWATDAVTANSVIVGQGQTAIVDVVFSCDANTYKGFQLDLETPTGVTPTLNDKSRPVYSRGARISDIEEYNVSSGQITSSHSRYICTAPNATPIAAGNDVLIRLSITVAADTPLDNYTGHITGIEFNTTDNVRTLFDDIEFTITVTEPRTILDETSTTMPEASDGAVDVRVRRTIKANEWSTICLPFAMTAAQTKEAFGDDVQLADFTGYEAEEDGDGNIVGITVHFSNVSDIEANHPYIIKVTEAVASFTVDGVTIAPEENPTVATIKRTRKQWSELIGTYVAQTELPSETLFLCDNQFWYSTDAMKMKGYRAYFDFYDVLTDMDKSYEIKMFIDTDGIVTKIKALNAATETGSVYDLSGRMMNKPRQSGIYIVRRNDGTTRKMLKK